MATKKANTYKPRMRHTVRDQLDKDTIRKLLKLRKALVDAA